MRIVVFTSNAIRHKFVANKLSYHANNSLIISECKSNDSKRINEREETFKVKHFRRRYQVEKNFFSKHNYFNENVLPILHQEVNMSYVYEIVKNYNPDMAFVFGSSIIKEPLLSLIPDGRFINLHLGLSPYYRGSGTNFWPFVNKELEYVGATLLHIDSGIDTGNIIAHIRPEFELGDNVHIIGNKVIKKATNSLIKIMDKVNKDIELKSIEQWNAKNEKYYRSNDFTKEIYLKYKKNLKNGLVEKYIKNKENKNIKLISLND